MPQSLAKIVLHLVYSTKHRQHQLQDVELRTRLWAYMAVVMRDRLESSAILINGVSDHVHILFCLSRNFKPKEVVQITKTETSKWLKDQSPDMHDFAWQSGYGMFSVSESNIPQLKDYISRQEEHHRTMSFQEEFRALCEKHGIEIDERYVWD